MPAYSMYGYQNPNKYIKLVFYIKSQISRQVEKNNDHYILILSSIEKITCDKIFKLWNLTKHTDVIINFFLSTNNVNT